MGSGTTAEACILEGRNYIGCELDEKWYRKSLDRIENIKYEESTKIFTAKHFNEQQTLFSA